MIFLNKLKSIFLATLLGGMACILPSINHSADSAWAGGRGGGRSYSGGRVSVGGYFRSNGTYVNSHTRSAPGSRYGGSNTSGYVPGSANSGYDAEMDELMNNPFRYYMKKGYAELKEKSYYTALGYFQMAEIEKPGNPYAKKAIANVQKYIDRGQ